MVFPNSKFDVSRRQAGPINIQDVPLYQAGPINMENLPLYESV